MTGLGYHCAKAAASHEKPWFEEESWKEFWQYKVQSHQSQRLWIQEPLGANSVIHIRSVCLVAEFVFDAVFAFLVYLSFYYCYYQKGFNRVVAIIV